MSQRENILQKLGYPLDRVPGPGAIYKPVVICGSIAYVSGAVPMDGDQLASAGKVPSEVSLKQAQEAAALCAANSLRMVLLEIGTLDRVKRVLRLTGYVNSDPDFTDQHLVINGASQLLVDVLGEAGIGARTAVGMAQLPLGSSTEVEMILELTEKD